MSTSTDKCTRVRVWVLQLCSCSWVTFHEYEYEYTPTLVVSFLCGLIDVLLGIAVVVASHVQNCYFVLMDHGSWDSKEKQISFGFGNPRLRFCFYVVTITGCCSCCSCWCRWCLLLPVVVCCCCWCCWCNAADALATTDAAVVAVDTRCCWCNTAM